MTIRPLADRVVVKLVEAEEKTKTGIILTAASQEKPQVAEVVAVGPGGLVDGKWNYYGECPHYISAADVVPKSEVEEIFELFEELVDVQDSLLMEESLIYLPRKLAELKKKYTEEKNNK